MLTIIFVSRIEDLETKLAKLESDIEYFGIEKEAGEKVLQERKDKAKKKADEASHVNNLQNLRKQEEERTTERLKIAAEEEAEANRVMEKMQEQDKIEEQRRLNDRRIADEKYKIALRDRQRYDFEISDSAFCRISDLPTTRCF